MRLECVAAPTSLAWNERSDLQDFSFFKRNSLSFCCPSVPVLSAVDQQSSKGHTQRQTLTTLTLALRVNYSMHEFQQILSSLGNDKTLSSHLAVCFQTANWRWHTWQDKLTLHYFAWCCVHFPLYIEICPFTDCFAL